MGRNGREISIGAACAGTLSFATSHSDKHYVRLDSYKTRVNMLSPAQLDHLPPFFIGVCLCVQVLCFSVCMLQLITLVPVHLCAPIVLRNTEIYAAVIVM